MRLDKFLKYKAVLSFCLRGASKLLFKRSRLHIIYNKLYSIKCDS